MAGLRIEYDALFLPQYSPDSVPRGISIVLSTMWEVGFIKPTPLNHSIEFSLPQIERTTYRYNIESTVPYDFLDQEPCFVCSNISQEQVMFDGIPVAPYKRNFIKAKSDQQTITVVIDRHTMVLDWDMTVLGPQSYSS